jgi:hypothetical protein
MKKKELVEYLSNLDYDVSMSMKKKELEEIYNNHNVIDIKEDIKEDIKQEEMIKQEYINQMYRNKVETQFKKHLDKLYERYNKFKHIQSKKDLLSKQITGCKLILDNLNIDY